MGPLPQAAAGTATLTVQGAPPSWSATRADGADWQVTPPAHQYAQPVTRLAEWLLACGDSLMHVQLQTARVTALSVPCAAPTATTTLREVTTASLPLAPAQFAEAYSGDQHTVVPPRASIHPQLPVGPELVVTRHPLTTLRPDRLLFLRDLPASPAPIVVNLDAPEVVRLRPYLLHVSGATLPLLGQNVQLRTCAGTLVGLANSNPVDPVLPYAQVPEEALRPCDQHLFSAVALQSTDDGRSSAVQYAARTLHAPEDVELVLPPLPNPPEVRWQGGLPTFSWANARGAPPLLLEVEVTGGGLNRRAFLSGLERGGYTPPNPSQLPGWQSAWTVQRGELSWSFNALGGTVDPEVLLTGVFGMGLLQVANVSPNLPDGAYVTLAGVSGILTAP